MYVVVAKFCKLQYIIASWIEFLGTLDKLDVKGLELKKGQEDDKRGKNDIQRTVMRLMTKETIAQMSSVIIQTSLIRMRYTARKSYIIPPRIRWGDVRVGFQCDGCCIPRPRKLTQHHPVGCVDVALTDVRTGRWQRVQCRHHTDQQHSPEIHGNVRGSCGHPDHRLLHPVPNALYYHNHPRSTGSHPEE